VLSQYKVVYCFLFLWPEKEKGKVCHTRKWQQFCLQRLWFSHG
jgi:hypothetical protein